MINKIWRLLNASVIADVIMPLSVAVPTAKAAENPTKAVFDTPEKLLRHMAEICLREEPAKLMECFDISTRVREVGAKSVIVTLQLGRAKAELRDATFKKFGTNEAAQLNPEFILPAGVDPSQRFAEVLKGAKIRQDGEKAMVTYGNNPQAALVLIRKAGGWLAIRELSSMGAANISEAYEMMEANRYLMLGTRDCLKVLPESKSIAEANRRFQDAIDKRMAVFRKESAGRTTP